MKFCTAFLIFFSAVAHTATQKPVIVIDPGHGGNDQGAKFKIKDRTLLEKEITLDLSKLVAVELEKLGYTAILTRNQDQELILTERTEMANRLKAKLFISIHINTSSSYSTDTQKAEGIEVFILNHSTPASSKRLADLENSVLKGSVADQPKNEVGLIIKDLILDSNRAESRKLACMIQSDLIRATSSSPAESQKRNRGVKEGLFYILLGADMPSVLVEAGFIGHPKDQYWLLDTYGKRAWVEGFARSVDSYFKLQNPAKIRQILSSCQKR